jgi:predicted MFS family arabinose efflux permease
MPDQNLRPTSPGSTASSTIIWIIGFFAFLNVYSMQSVLPLLMLDFHASPVQAGATVGATVLAVALVSPFMGMLSDALGRKRILCFSLFALTVPTALIPAADTLATIVAMRFVQGLFIPGIVVVIIAYIAEEFSAQGVARMTTIYVGGTVMGGFCGRFITGHAGDLLGWRGAFATLAALNLLGAALTLWRLPPSARFTPNRQIGKALRTLRRHLQNRRLLAAGGVGFCVLFSLVGSFTYVNVLLASPPFNLSPAGLANIFSVYLLGVVVTPIAGRFIVRAGFRRSLLCALSISAVGLLLTLVPSLAAVVCGLAACSSGAFMCQAATISFIADCVSEGRSLATGLYNLAYYAGGAAGTGIAGVAFETHGWPGSVSAIITVQCLAAAIAWFGWRKPQAPAKGAGER